MKFVMMSYKVSTTPLSNENRRFVREKRYHHSSTRERQTHRCPKQLRSVTLLNLDYKTATKVIANRLAEVLPDIISPNQTGYVKNRYTGENVRLKAKQAQGIVPFS